MSKKCFHEIGEDALDDDGCCIGCGLAAEYLAKMNCCGTDVDKSCVRFANDIHGRIDYFRQEFDISYAEVIGMLEIIKQDMYMEIGKVDDES